MSVTTDNFSHPRYWPTWLFIGLLKGLAQLPYSVLLWIGRTLGGLMYLTMRRRGHIAALNLKLCFPELNDLQRENLAKAHFAALGIALMETALAWYGPLKRLGQLAQLEGLEHLQRAHEQGKGVILIGAHYTTLEISGPLLAHLSPVPVRAVYRPHENHLLNKAINARRSARVAPIISRNDIKVMVKALRNGEVVWFASDQNFGLRNSVFAPFFGVPAATNTAVLRLAELTKAPVLFYTSQRLPGNSGYKLTIEPPLRDFPSDDPQADMTRVHQVMERHIRQMPEQYLWVHRRFKDRPDGRTDTYENPNYA